MNKSPNTYLDGVLNVKVLVNGKNIENDYSLISFKVQKEINRISKALLVFEAGDMPAGEISESDNKSFDIGNSIEIKAGYGKTLKTIFSGIVVYQSPEVTSQNNTTLQVECRDLAYTSTLMPDFNYFIEKTDKQIIETLFDSYGLKSQIENMDAKHDILVQHDSTDWDFVLNRANVNGMIIISDGENIRVEKPQIKTIQNISVHYGEDLIEFNGKLNTINQYKSVVIQAWDPGKQHAIEAKSKIPYINDQGSPKDKPMLDTYFIKTCANISQEDLQKMADAEALKMGLARIQGSCKFCGNADLEIGKLITISGCGKRFDGEAFVGGLEHDFNEEGWTTTITMGASFDFDKGKGGTSKSSSLSSETSSSSSSSKFAPGIQGLFIGKVIDLEDKSGKEYRIQVEIPSHNDKKMEIWARMANFWGSNSYGSFFIPDIGDEVILGFIDNNPAYPVILGSMYSSKQPPPYEIEAVNKIRAIKTKSKMIIEFQEEDKIITIQTPGKNIVKISDKDKGIELTDQNKNKIVMNDSGIVIESSKGLTLKAKNDITIEAGMNLKMKAKSNIEQKGINVELKANASLTLKGTANAELSASGQTVVKGAMVMIN